MSEEDDSSASEKYTIELKKNTNLSPKGGNSLFARGLRFQKKTPSKDQPPPKK